MPDGGPSGRGKRHGGDTWCRAWYRRIGAALEAYLFPFDLARRRARLERERALLVPPPVPELFPWRLANLGLVRHGEVASGGEGYITPPLCHVDAGLYLMGSDPREDPEAEVDELPQHTVETESYRIGAYPVTVAEYDCAVRAGIVREPRYGLITWTYQLQRLDVPVACISWTDATAYAAWLARLTGQAWRLPTEAEWEKATRGTDGRIYPWGNQWDSSRANVDEFDARVLDHERQNTDTGGVGTGKRRSLLARAMAKHPNPSTMCRHRLAPLPSGATRAPAARTTSRATSGSGRAACSDPTRTLRATGVRIRRPRGHASCGAARGATPPRTPARPTATATPPPSPTTVWDSVSSSPTVQDLAP